MELDEASGEGLDEPMAVGPGPSTEASLEDAHQYLLQRLERSQIPPLYRKPLQLVFIEQRTRDEAARILEVSPVTFRKQLHRALEMWRREVAESSSAQH